MTAQSQECLGNINRYWENHMIKLEKLRDEIIADVEKEQQSHLDYAKRRFDDNPESMHPDAPIRLAERQEAIRVGYLLCWNFLLERGDIVNVLAKLENK